MTLVQSLFPFYLGDEGCCKHALAGGTQRQQMGNNVADLLRR